MTPEPTAYSPEGWAIIIAAITSAVLGAISALGTLVLNILAVRQGRQLVKQDVKLDKQEVKLEEHREGVTKHLEKQDETLDRVDKQTNGNISALVAEIAALRLQNADLKATADAKAGLVEQARVLSHPAPRRPARARRKRGRS